MCLYLYITESSQVSSPLLSPSSSSRAVFAIREPNFALGSSFSCSRSFASKVGQLIGLYTHTHTQYTREFVYKEKSLLNSDYNGARRREEEEKGLQGESRLSFSFFYFCKKSSLTQRSVKGRRRREALLLSSSSSQ